MNTTVLVSVCMITYNHELYIADAIESIITQKTNFSFELIIGEDHSTDNTFNICLEYQKKYPNIIKLIRSSKNIGFKENFYKSLKACSGKYIAFCEGDDYWIDLFKLQKQINFLEKDKTTSYLFTNRKIRYQKDNLPIKEETSNYKIKIYSTKHFLSGFNPGIQSICFKKELLNFELLKKYINTINGDRLLPYLLSLQGNIKCLPDITSVYRVTGKGVSTKISKEEWFVHAISDFYRFHSTLGFPDMKCYAKGQAKYILGNFIKNRFNLIHSFKTNFSALKSHCPVKRDKRIYFIILYYTLTHLLSKIKIKIEDKFCMTSDYILRKFRSTCFSSVIITPKTKDIFDLRQIKEVKQFNSPRINLFNKTVTIADPFLFENKDILYLFYELQHKWNAKGVLNVCHTVDLKHWSKPEIALEEDFHLSFPFVFKDKDEIYMIPETCQTNSIRLYKAKSDSLKFSFVKTLIQGEKYVDSSIYLKEGIYYLFTSIQTPENSYIQQLYFTDSLTGNWEIHPASPIAAGKQFGRNAGAIFSANDNLYRPAQNCTKFYGNNISIFQITNLSPTEYKEVPSNIDIIPKGWKNSIGGHQYNSLIYKDKRIIAIDLIKKTFNWYCVKQRFINSFRKNNS